MNYIYNNQMVMLEIVKEDELRAKRELIQRTLGLVGAMLKEQDETSKEELGDSMGACDPVCILICAEGEAAIMTVRDAEKRTRDADYCIEVMEGQLLLRCCSDDVVCIGGTEYLLGKAIIFEMDEDGNDCCVDYDTVRLTTEFLDENSTDIEVDGEIYDALRLV